MTNRLLASGEGPTLHRWDRAVFADTAANGGFRQNRTIERHSVSACERSNLGVSC